MSLHPLVIFIGDRPNPKKNLSLDVPFVGTPSYKTLLEWIYRMDIDIRQVGLKNAYDIDGEESTGLFPIIPSSKSLRVIVLGQAAKKRIDDFNRLPIRPIKYFYLPHPSGLNRELNDKKKLSQMLTRCRNFVYGGVYE